MIATRLGGHSRRNRLAFGAPLACAVALLSCAALSCAATADAAAIDVVLLAGQSNMAGRAERSELPTELQQPRADVKLYLGGDTLGLPSQTWIALQPGASQFGPEITLGRALADLHPTRSFAFIKHAAGGTDLHADWNPQGSGNLYADFLSTVAAGLQALRDDGYEPNVIGMVWMQGERDARDNVKANAYQGNLAAFVAAARNDLFDGLDAPFAIGRLPDNQTDLPSGGRQLVQAAQDWVHANVANVGLVNTNGFSLDSDDLHFNAEGQQALGTAFAQELTAFVPEPASVFASALLLLGFMSGRRSSIRRNNR